MLHWKYMLKMCMIRFADGNLCMKKLLPGRWIAPVIPRSGRLRQEDCHKFKDSLGYKTLSPKRAAGETAQQVKTLAVPV